MKSFEYKPFGYAEIFADIHESITEIEQLNIVNSVLSVNGNGSILDEYIDCIEAAGNSWDEAVLVFSEENTTDEEYELVLRLMTKVSNFISQCMHISIQLTELPPEISQPLMKLVTDLNTALKIDRQHVMETWKAERNSE